MMSHGSVLGSRCLSAVLSAALALVGLSFVTPVADAVLPGTAAAGDAQPVTAPITERTGVSADSLPTVQIDGVVWAQAVRGDTVYAGGEFTTARPAGAAPGVNTVPRANLLAYNLRTGELIASFAPSVNAKVKSLAVSADGSRLYVGGSFTQANGQTRNRMAAFNTSDGSLVAGFAPDFSSTVNTMAVTSDAIYAGGLFWRVGNSNRPRLAAVRPSDGALLGWAPSATGSDAYVQGLALTPDKSKVVVGGSFKSMNGSYSPGLATLDAVTGTSYPMPATSVVENFGKEASWMSMRVDSSGTAYSTGYAWGQAATRFEGVAAIDTSSGEFKWLGDCHGDSYDAIRMGDAVYSVSHHHNCENIGGFPDTNPRTFWQYANAFSAEPTGAVRQNRQGAYGNFAGQPAPSLMTWFPTLGAGTYTGTSQAGWTLEATDEYLLVGGEFPWVNGGRQQGLARFAVRPLATGKQRPQLMAPEWVATASSPVSSVTHVSVPANWDRDDYELTYDLFREGFADPVATAKQTSTWWNRPQVALTDRTSQAPGSTQRYRVRVSDRDGNRVFTDWVPVVIGPTLAPYLAAAFEDNPTHLWRPDGSSKWSDMAGRADAVVSGSVTEQGGVLPGDVAAGFNQSWWRKSWASTRTSEAAPDEVSIEAWFNTTSTEGGKIVGFGSAAIVNSLSNDRNVYMKANGQLVFGVYPGSVVTVESQRAYNDGQWHHVVATMSSAGLKLVIDGAQVGSSAAATTGQAYKGYWRIGGDSLRGWPGAGATHLAGAIDEVAIYPKALTLDRIRAHYEASGRKVDIPAAPADPYGMAVVRDDPQFYWRFDDAAGDARDQTGNANGVVSGVLTRGASSPVAPGTGYALSGEGSLVRTPFPEESPNVYSTEIWFNTTSARGGKLISFGNAASGLSNNYDRQIYMDQAGKLFFGIWRGRAYTIESTASYNDGQWHHAVATQGPDGMKLYVDGQLIGSTPQAVADTYSGYWRVGGDKTWVAGDSYIQATVDEVAVYGRVLTAQQVRAHYGASPAGPNLAPVADFTATCTALTCEFTATTSDADGQVASRQWTFGDGTSASGPTARHTYTTGGTREVTLTVTDDKGAATVVTKQVAAFAAPVADFTASCTALTCAFDGSASTPADGSTYAWVFSDGGTASGITTTREFASPGTYDATLTVTNGAGATHMKTVQVRVLGPNVAPVAVVASATTGLRAEVDGSGSTDSDGTVVGYSWTFGDGGTATGATASHTYASAGTYDVTLTVTDDRGGTHAVTHQVTVSDAVFADAFRRTGSQWGVADTGGTWTHVYPAYFSTNGSAGLVTLPSGGRSAAATLTGSARDVSVSVKLSASAQPTGGALFNRIRTRVNGSSYYDLTVYMSPTNGAVNLTISAIVDGARTSLGDGRLPGLAYSADDVLNVTFETAGDATTTLRAKVWKDGTPEPTAWQTTRTDSTPALRAPGGFGLENYSSSVNTALPVTIRWADLVVAPVG